MNVFPPRPVVSRADPPAEVARAQPDVLAERYLGTLVLVPEETP